MIEFERLLHHLGTTEAWLEVLALLALLTASYAWVARLGRRASPDSVLLGQKPWTGLLFPLLALAGAYACEVDRKSTRLNSSH